MTKVEAVTLAIAVLGAVLGLVNTWHALDSSRVKIRVVPAHAIPFGHAPRVNVCISVSNLSSFPVTVSEVGFFYHGTDKRAVLIDPLIVDGGSWPRRLEPRSSVSVYGTTPDPHAGYRLKCAYSRTDCGVTTIGSSPALRQLSRDGGL